MGEDQIFLVSKKKKHITNEDKRIIGKNGISFPLVRCLIRLSTIRL